MLELTFGTMAKRLRFMGLPGRIHLTINGKGISGILPVSFAFNKEHRQATEGETTAAAPHNSTTKRAPITNSCSRRLIDLIVEPRRSEPPS